MARLMSSETIGNFYEQGNHYLVEAIKLDHSGAVSMALKQYILASTYMIKALEHEKDEHIKVKLNKKIDDILTRSETLKAFMASGEMIIDTPPLAASSKPSSSRPHKEIPSPSRVSKDPEDKNVTSKDWFISEKPKVSWDDVIGLGHVKQVISESFEMPLRFPVLFQGNRKPWSGMLLYGPPGTGKTLIAKAMATQLEAEFINVKTADIVSKYQGDSEKQVKQLFDQARERAKESPVIIFIDEIDAIGMDRTLNGGGDSASSANVRLVTQLLMEMDGLESQNINLFMIGATNLPWNLDTGILRRFPKRLYVPLPHLKAREQILRYNLMHNNHLLTDDDFMQLAAKTKGYSGSDLSNLIKEVLMFPIKDIMTATLFFQNPNNDKFLPVLREEDKNHLLKQFGDLYQMRYQKAPQFIERRWQDLTNDTVDSDIPVTQYHITESLMRIKPSTNLTLLAKYTQWTQEHAEQEINHVESSLED